MKVIVNESKLGVEYIADVISSCNQNGVECIVDDNAGDILYYDPKGAKYGTDKLLRNSDVSIFDALQDRNLFADTMRDAQGDGFKQFAVQWNGLQKKTDEDEVFKTDHCNPIRGNFSEVALPKAKMTKRNKELFDKFRAKWKSFDDKGLSPEDKAHLERIKNARDDFGDKVNGIEARVSEGGNMLAKEIEVDLVGREYSELKKHIEDMAQSYWEEDNMGGGTKSEMLQNLYSDVLDWLNRYGVTKNNHNPVVMTYMYKKFSARDFAKEILDDVYEKNKDNYVGESTYDDDDYEARDWSASEGEVEIEWTTDAYNDFGIFSGDCSNYVIDYDMVDDHEDLVDEVCRLIGKEYPDLDFEPDDFTITNEDEFWDGRRGM